MYLCSICLLLALLRDASNSTKNPDAAIAASGGPLRPSIAETNLNFKLQHTQLLPKRRVDKRGLDPEILPIPRSSYHPLAPPRAPRRFAPSSSSSSFSSPSVDPQIGAPTTTRIPVTISEIRTATLFGALAAFMAATTVSALTMPMAPRTASSSMATMQPSLMTLLPRALEELVEYSIEPWQCLTENLTQY